MIQAEIKIHFEVWDTIQDGTDLPYTSASASLMAHMEDLGWEYCVIEYWSSPNMVAFSASRILEVESEDKGDYATREKAVLNSKEYLDAISEIEEEAGGNITDIEVSL